MKYFERLGISPATVMMVSVALVLVTILLCIAELSFSSTLKGMFAAMTASLIFGSTGVPMKLPPSTESKHDKIPPKIDPFLFAVWTSVGIFLISCPLMIFLEFHFAGGFIFKPWAVLGSADVMLISYITFHAVQMLGYARAPAIWASVGMTTAFTLGVTAFKEAISNIVLGSLAIPTLILGVVLILSCQQVVQTDNSPSIANAAFTALNSINTMEEEEEEETIYLSTDPDRGKQIEIEMASIQTDPYDKYDDLALSSGTENKKKVSSVSGNSNDRAVRGSVSSTADNDHRGNSFQEGANLGTLLLKSINLNEWSDIIVTIKAVGLCVIAGICDGSLMVPFKLSLVGSTSDSKLHDTLCYLASFGLASLAITPIVFLLHWVMYIRSHRGSNIHSMGRIGEGDTTSTRNAMHAYNRTEVTADSEEKYESVPLSWDSSSYSRQWSSSIVPGLSSGILWAAGNIMSVHATWFLGMKVGFPLTQTCVVFNALWGIFYFKEIDLFDKKSKNLLRFACGLAAVVLGSFFLADSAA